jgi:hypothetical protein
MSKRVKMKDPGSKMVMVQTIEPDWHSVHGGTDWVAQGYQDGYDVCLVSVDCSALS